jgi:hypothetical protein
MTAFWDAAPCSLEEKADVSEVCTTSIIRAVIETVATSETSVYFCETSWLRRLLSSYLVSCEPIISRSGFGSRQRHAFSFLPPCPDQSRYHRPYPVDSGGSSDIAVTGAWKRLTSCCGQVKNTLIFEVACIPSRTCAYVQQEIHQISSYFPSTNDCNRPYHARKI